jgi:hypothetical protein
MGETASLRQLGPVLLCPSVPQSTCLGSQSWLSESSEEGVRRAEPNEPLMEHLRIVRNLGINGRYF